MSNSVLKHLASLKLLLLFLIIDVKFSESGSPPNPSIQTVPQRMTEGNEGDEVTIFCTVKNLGIYNVSWLRDAQRITLNKVVLVDKSYYEILNHGENDFALKIEPVRRDDDRWDYKCAVFDNDVMITTHTLPAKVKVLEVPKSKYPICDPIKSGYIENSVVRVTCRGETIQPKVKLEWTKNGTTLEGTSDLDKNRKEDLLNYTFVAQQNDSGALLKCSMFVKITGKTMFCSPGQLNVLYKPKITIHVPDSLPVNKEAVYICLSNANPQTHTHKWNIPDHLKSDPFQPNQAVLRITPTINDNMTEIACTATNSIGSATKKITLNLQKSESSTNTRESKPSVNNENTDSSTVSLFAIVLVAVGCSSLILLLMVIPVCYYYTCQRQEEGLYMPRRPPIMLQPDVYSEPKDMAFSSDPNENRTLPMIPSRTVHGKWKRSVGVQVPLEIEIEDVYAHVEGEGGALNISRSRSTKSEYV
ncbi:CD166 antigen homolog [Antedon mediterranea]|uniref:CD166 antigen homolog n=1 Tax=Antedon mediterranea TaxID=105859 RepID=UPI003AF7CF80